MSDGPRGEINAGLAFLGLVFAGVFWGVSCYNEKKAAESGGMVYLDLSKPHDLRSYVGRDVHVTNFFVSKGSLFWHTNPVSDEVLFDLSQIVPSREVMYRVYGPLGTNQLNAPFLIRFPATHASTLNSYLVSSFLRGRLELSLSPPSDIEREVFKIPKEVDRYVTLKLGGENKYIREAESTWTTSKYLFGASAVLWVIFYLRCRRWKRLGLRLLN